MSATINLTLSGITQTITVEDGCTVGVALSNANVSASEKPMLIRDGEANLTDLDAEVKDGDSVVLASKHNNGS